MLVEVICYIWYLYKYFNINIILGFCVKIKKLYNIDIEIFFALDGWEYRVMDLVGNLLNSMEKF